MNSQLYRDRLWKPSQETLVTLYNTRLSLAQKILLSLRTLEYLLSIKAIQSHEREFAQSCPLSVFLQKPKAMEKIFPMLGGDSSHVILLRNSPSPGSFELYDRILAIHSNWCDLKK